MDKRGFNFGGKERDDMKTIGIIGGMGPMATVYFLECITHMTAVEKDQEHPRVFLESIPDIPDRTDYILGKSTENPLPYMIEAGKSLVKMGADFLTMPCVTAHYFYEALSQELRIPLIPLTRVLAEDIQKSGIQRVGIMATSGTIQSKAIERELKRVGISSVLPDRDLQQILMNIIYGQIKKDAPIQWKDVERIGNELKKQGAEKIILGCTELPLLKKSVWQAENASLSQMLFGDCIDVLEVLAQKAVLESGAVLKDRYRDVIGVGID